eukprot:CAMPEP_0197053754 /NCGR_PEP_ID=MMETSP1384-20130603/27927_1 /TAXON_ID=29189 /ORGANISM="Ammonia sp." /LENGTH=502 /DNA_ID=CAMNT_0042486695 /DNA_START=195 /DNA_END=1703 /DNA_ORIENTATION=+
MRATFALYPLFNYTVLYVVAHRCWHIVYKAHWYKEEANSQWKYHLNESLVSHNFWLRYKTTFGHCYYTRRALVLWLVVWIIVSVTWFQIALSGSDSSVSTANLMPPYILTNVLILIPVVLIIVFYVLAPAACSDTFYIRAEFKRLSIIACCQFAAYVACAVFKYLGLMEHAEIISTIGFVITSSTAFFAIAMTQTAFIYRTIYCRLFHFNEALLHKNDSHAQLKSADVGFLFGEFEAASLAASKSQSTLYHNAYNTPALPTLPSRLNGLKIPSLKSIELQLHPTEMSGDAEIELTSSEFAKKVRLYHLMSRADTFEILMQHIASEYSQEILLCLLEIVQWKRWLFNLYETINDGKRIATKQCAHPCLLNEIMPLSSIVLKHFFNAGGKLKEMKDNDELMEAAKRAAYDLLIKYVNVGSMLEINIADGARRRLCGICGDLERFLSTRYAIDELYALFDPVADELIALANHSFVRMKSKPEWIKVLYLLSRDSLVGTERAVEHE